MTTAAPEANTPNPDHLRFYLEAVETSSGRSRWLTIVLTIASIITFFAYWNSLPYSWLRGRAETGVAARDLLLAPEKRYALFEDEKRGALYRRAWNLIENKHWNRVHEPLRIPIEFTAPAPLDPDTTTAHTASAIPDSLRRFSGTVQIDMTVMEADRYARELEKEWLHKVIVLDVPFLGITFDLNDLGLLAGLAFAVVLVMRKMSLNSEFQNLKITLLFGLRISQLRPVYDLVAMRQVLTIPRRPRDSGSRRYAELVTNFYRVLTAIPDWAPVAIITLVYLRNWATVDVGVIASPFNTQLSMAFSMVLVFATLFLTGLCVWTEHRMHKLFDVVAIAIQQQDEPVQSLLEQIEAV